MLKQKRQEFHEFVSASKQLSHIQGSDPLQEQALIA